MVLTRLSHVGEVCPLSDHSYSDSVNAPSTVGSVPITSTQIVLASKSISVLERDRTEDEGTRIVIHILDFPNEILEEIFSHINFRGLGDIRCICKRFERVAANILNKAFQRLQNDMLIRFQETKSLMPRRESARRKHPLARESDILEILHMRLTLLQMTFGKHIERKHCCFFAGEILDEVFRILRCIKNTPNMGKVFKITDELFDLSTMAMEYFKEFIEPNLPEISYFHSDFLEIGNRYSESEDEPEPPQSQMVLRKRIRKIRQGMRRYNSQLAGMKRELRQYKNRIIDQNKTMNEYTSRMEEYDKKFDEASRKFNQVLQELNRCKTELQYWRSRSPIHTVMCCGCCSNRSHSNEHGKTPSEDKAGLLSLQGFLSPSNSSIKNLESLFDDEKASTAGSSFSNYSVPSTSSSTHGGGSGSSSYSEKPDESSNKRNMSSDDDSDLDVDTVGKRVKERKRIKLH